MKYLRGSIGVIVIAIIFNLLLYTIWYFNDKSVWIDPLCIFNFYFLPMIFICKNHFEKSKEKKTNILWCALTILFISLLAPTLNELVFNGRNSVQGGEF